MQTMQTVPAAVAQIAYEVQTRIADLENLFEDSLDDEMDALKEVLVANPSAAALLKDEDIGALVTALRRTVNVAITEAVAAKSKPRAKKGATKLSEAEIAAALAAEGL